MSTKTSIKRIAAVAALALTLGGFSAVAANAATAITATNSVTSTPVASATATPGAAGTAITGNLQITPTGGESSATTIPITWHLLDPNGTDVTSTVTFSNATLGTGITSSTLASNVDTVVVAAAATGAQTVAQYSFTPLMGGEYTWKYTTGTSTGDNITTQTNATVNNTPNLFVSGAGAQVAVSGVGSSTATAVTGGVAVIRFATAAKTVTTTYNLTTSGVGVIQTAAAGTNAPAAGGIVGIAGTTDFSQGVKVTTTNDTTQNDVLATVASTVAGTQTLTWAAISSTTGAPTTVATVTITWTATASTAVTSLSTAFINPGPAYAASNNTTLTAADTAVGANGLASANIGVSLNDATGLPVTAQKLTVTIAGPGLIQVAQVTSLTGISAANLTSPVRAYSDTTANSSNNWMIGLFADGTAGTSTITIAVGSTVIATKAFTFTGAVAAIKVTQNFSIAKASSTGAELGVATSNTSATTGYVPAITAEVKDANGNDVNGTLSCLSSDLTVISSCVIVADNNATYGAGTGFYNVDVVSAPGGKSGSTATVTVRYQNSDGTYISAAPLTFTLGGVIASTTATLDAATYTPGSPMQLTITAKDSAGNPTYDNQSIAYSISANLPVGGALPSTAKVFANGKYATSLTAPTLFAPSVSGPFTITVVGNDVANTATSVSAAVTGGESAVAANAATDAANEATDAANAATDAANAAADAADAATSAAQDAGAKADAALAAVTALSAKITVLAAQIAKIVKKLKA